MSIHSAREAALIRDPFAAGAASGDERWRPNPGARMLASRTPGCVLRCVRSKAHALRSIPYLSGEYALIDLRRVAEYDEADVAHVFLRDALHLSGRDRAQPFKKIERVPPATADQFVLGQFRRLSTVGFLAN